ncbi:hypothetical protein [Archaeoglobus sp.]
MKSLKEIYEKVGIGVCLIGRDEVDCYMVPDDIKPYVYEIRDKILTQIEDIEGGIFEFEKIKVVLVRCNDDFLAFPVEGDIGTLYYDLRNLVRGFE